MEADEDFNPAEVHRLVDLALGEGTTHSPPERATIGLSPTDVSLLSCLATVLPRYTDRTQEVLDELRATLGADVELPELRLYHTMIRRCRKCPARQPTPQLPWGVMDHPPIVVVYEAPPSERDQSWVWQSLRECGLGDQVAVSYLTRCPLGTGRVTTTEIETCAPYLLTELEIWRPRLILLLGLTVSSALLGPLKITEEHGKVFWVGPWALMPLLSPAYVLKNQVEERFLADLRKAAQFATGAVGAGETPVS